MSSDYCFTSTQWQIKVEFIDLTKKKKRIASAWAALMTVKIDYLVNAEAGLACWKEVLTISQECYLRECCGFGSHALRRDQSHSLFRQQDVIKSEWLFSCCCRYRQKKSLVEVKDLVVVCLAATLWPLNCPRLWRSHRRDVTTTFTAHQTRATPEFSVCSSARGCMSASVKSREQGRSDCGFLIRGLELSVKLPCSDAGERVQKCSRNLVSRLFYTRPCSSLKKWTFLSNYKG